MKNDGGGKMRKVFLFAALLLCGCRSKEAPLALDPDYKAPVDTGMLEADWETAYSRKANLYTTETYACISEMYSLAFTPVDSGPVCRDACAQKDEVNAFVKAAPQYVVNPSQYILQTKGGGMCSAPKKRRHR